MSNPPAFWPYILSNALVLVLGATLTILSGRAYYRVENPSFGTAALGFALITGGSLVEAVYELGIQKSFALTEGELLALHATEGLIIAVGLGALFYSLWRY